MPISAIHVFPFDTPILDNFAAEFILAHEKSLPDLTNQVILLANPVAAPALRRSLLQQTAQHQITALLGPQITNLNSWLKQFIPDDLTICDEATQKLILVDELRRYPHITGEVNAWAYVDDLMQLFSELTLANIKLPDNAAQFIQTIADAYAIDLPHRQQLEPFYSREATLVYTLWQAWHKQLSQTSQIDAQAAWCLGLQNCLSQLDTLPHLHILGYHNFKPVELAWLNSLLAAGKATYYISAQPNDEMQDSTQLIHPACVVNQQLLNLMQPGKATKHDDFYAQIFTLADLPLNKQTLSAVFTHWQQHNQCEVYLAGNMEEEARAIDIQIRQWLLAGKTNIGIVTENRVLARRVRALLERSHIVIQDMAGWALSTTRLAGLLEHWLQCIEENFSYLPYLDILKSPLCFPEIDIAEQQHAAYRFEHDLVEEEKVLGDLAAYRKASTDRCARLAEKFSAANSLLHQVFDLSEQAAAPLLKHLQHTTSAVEFINALQASLEKIGLQQAFAKDAAGIEILKIIQAMSQLSSAGNIKLSWQEFRLWLATELESARFRPTNGEQAVKLMGLSQAQLQTFEAVIVAGLEHDILPGHSQIHTFFNDAVKHELKLTTSLDIKNEKFYHFRYLLSCAPVQLLTARHAQHGEPVNLSPWLDLILTAHEHLNNDIKAKQLMTLARSTDNQIYHSEYEMPAMDNEPTAQPQPALSASLLKTMLPTKLSASAWQQLVNCPYQFFAERCLKLKPIDEIKLQLSRADFGQRVHRCLQAFHQDITGLPGPFVKEVNDTTRDEAIALLNKLGNIIFANDLAIHYEHQAWLQQWQAVVPDFVDWLIRHSVDWTLFKIESAHETTLTLANQQLLQLTGTLDRLDKRTHADQDGIAITDYKTGKPSAKKDVLSGEAIQLPFYALLVNSPATPVLQVTYLALKRNEVKCTSTIAEDVIPELIISEQQRLIDVFSALNNNAPLPAWGDDKTCQRCDVSGLCRKGSWQELI